MEKAVLQVIVEKTFTPKHVENVWTESGNLFYQIERSDRRDLKIVGLEEVNSGAISISNHKSH